MNENSLSPIIKELQVYMKQINPAPNKLEIHC